jgi:2-aminobenzoylacetyl-CoA thioesterase
MADRFPLQLTNNLWVLGNYYFNLYLVIGKQASALIEVGVSSVVDEVIHQLGGLNVKPTFLIVTHPHTDHITGLPGLKTRFPSALVVAGEGAAGFLEHPKAAPALVSEDKHMSEFLDREGLQPGRPPLDAPPSLENCLTAKNGDQMDLGGVTLNYLTVKGHSPAKIVVWAPEIRALMLSDSLGFRYPGRGFFPLFLTNYHEYIAGLDELESPGPDIVGIAHQGPVIGREAVARTFAEARAAAIALRDLIVNDPREDEEIAREVFDRYYKDECTIYTVENIMNCARLLVKRARESLSE